ncbi:hypothetical protein ACJW30_07G059200 [Castanea mollissima]
MSHRVSSDKNVEINSHVESLPYVQKLGVPPRPSLWKEFRDTVKETFFWEDPLGAFKSQPGSTGYSFSKFKGDLIAGLTIASLSIPQDNIAYAKLARLPSENGLYKYSSFVPPLVYAVMGTSRDIAIGPVAVVSFLLVTSLQNLIDPSKNEAEYRSLVFTATFFAGVTQFALGFLRYWFLFIFMLGFLIDFLSHAAIVGYLAGTTITIGLQQLKGLLGRSCWTIFSNISNFTQKTDIVSVMRSVWSIWNWQTLVIGICFLTFLLLAQYIGKKNKKLFWVPAIAPLISVTLSTFIVYITRADKRGVQIVKHIKKSINPPSVNELMFHGEYLVKGITTGIMAGLIGLTEATASGRTFAAMKDYQLDGNKEMVALGTLNIIGSITSWPFSRTAVNVLVSCKTAVSNIVMSCVLLLTLYTPNAVMSAIIIFAMVGLIDIEAAVVPEHREIMLPPLTFMVGPTVYLMNGSHHECKRREHHSPCSGKEQLEKNSLPRVQHLIVEMSSVFDIDTSGVRALEELYGTLQKREVQLALANPGPDVILKLHTSKFANLIGENMIFLSVADAVRT